MKKHAYKLTGPHAEALLRASLPYLQLYHPTNNLHAAAAQLQLEKRGGALISVAEAWLSLYDQWEPQFRADVYAALAEEHEARAGREELKD